MLARIAAILAALLSLSAHADTWPSKPLRMVIPFPAGGPTDVMTRVVAEKLGAQLGQSVIVDNKPGAGGEIGAKYVADSAPDGYTFVMATGSTHSVGPYLTSKPPYDPVKDFTPIIWAGNSPNVLVVSPKLGFKSVRDLIAYARAHPGQLNFASSGVGSVAHLTGELFAHEAGIQLTHVPYKGTQLSLADLMSGQVAMLFDAIVTAKPHVDAGRLQALGISTRKRSPLMPNLPTISESGLPGFESYNWFGVFGPAGTPQPIVDRMNAQMNRVLQDPGVRARFAQLGFEPAGGTPAEFAAMMRSETAKWRKVIDEAHAKVE
ncbi:MAG TPA: tripartite tricarboxylate transporter substrate binding protein [Usitatibacter sp.]|nr:tripartite tricarboxylate transporter substrate binding protein [Usitatibacter sp.]